MSKISASLVKELRTITGSSMMDCKKALVETDGDIEKAKESLRKRGQIIANKKSDRETKEGSVGIFINDNSTKASIVKIGCETDFVSRNDKFKEFIEQISKVASEVQIENFEEQEYQGKKVSELFTGKITELGENIVFLEGNQWDVEGNAIVGSYIHSNGKIGVIVELKLDQATDNESIQVLAKDLAMHVAASNVEAIQESDLDPSVVEKEKAFLIDQAKDSGKPQEIIEKMIQGRLNKFKKEVCLLDQPFVKDPNQTIEQLVKDKSKETGATISVARFKKLQF